MAKPVGLARSLPDKAPQPQQAEAVSKSQLSPASWQAQYEAIKKADLHQADLAAGYAGVFLPRQLERKYRNAPKEFIWQWLFPAPCLSHVRETGEYRRYHPGFSPKETPGAVEQLPWERWRQSYESTIRAVLTQTRLKGDNPLSARVQLLGVSLLG